jgi:RHS repeat-associated protein
VSNLSYFPNTSPAGTGNGDQRLQQISNVVGTKNISNFEYTYNPVGTIATWQQQTDANPATQYALTYDAADQLVNAVNTNTSTHAVVNSNAYQFDLMGNRLAETTQSTTNVGQFNILNQLKAYTGSTTTQTVSGHTNTPITSSSIDDTVPVTISNGTNFTANVPVANGTNVVTIQAKNAAGTSGSQKVQFVTSGGNTPVKLSHDLNGNVTQDETGNAYTWDALNRLISITYPSGSSSTFGYDGGSRRISIVEKNSSGAVTSTKLYLWIGNSIADERNSTNVVQKRFYPQGEQQLGTPYFYTRDHLGSIRELTTSTGTIAARYDYDPYGVTTLVQGTNLADFQYAGMYLHQPSGLYLTWGRPYQPPTGRWLSRDPISEGGGMNIYGYCGNDPICNADPSGLGWDTPTQAQGIHFNERGGKGGFAFGLGVDEDGRIIPTALANHTFDEPRAQGILAKAIANEQEYQTLLQQANQMVGNRSYRDQDRCIAVRDALGRRGQSIREFEQAAARAARAAQLRAAQARWAAAETTEELGPEGGYVDIGLLAWMAGAAGADAVAYHEMHVSDVPTDEHFNDQVQNAPQKQETNAPAHEDYNSSGSAY